MRVIITIPAYNEEKTILSVINDLQSFFQQQSYKYEIIVINDSSSDKTAELVKSQPQIKLISHPYNKGYGASLKTGVKNALYDWVLFFDSDGQHESKSLPALLEKIGQYDMVVGARNGYEYKKGFVAIGCVFQRIPKEAELGYDGRLRYWRIEHGVEGELRSRDYGAERKAGI